MIDEYCQKLLQHGMVMLPVEYWCQWACQGLCRLETVVIWVCVTIGQIDASFTVFVYALHCIH